MNMPAISLAPSVIFHLGPIPVTTTLILQIVVILLIVTTFIVLAKSWRTIPGKFQAVMEMLLTAAYAQVQNVTHNEQRTKMLFPLSFSLFIFILVSNLITLFPGLGAISLQVGDQQISLFRSVLADYSMILVMTVLVVMLCQIGFVMTHGFGKYLKNFFDFSGPIAFFLGLMNIISEFAKVLSLSFRLYGNVFAGEVLMAVITALVPYFVPFPFFVLSTFSSVIQAYVFALLSTIFINSTLEVAEG